jgi:hypothetical protein
MPEFIKKKYCFCTKHAQTCLSGQGNEIDNQKTSGLLWLSKSYMEMHQEARL